jgi:hypothetical protein
MHRKNGSVRLESFICWSKCGLFMGREYNLRMGRCLAKKSGPLISGFSVCRYRADVLWVVGAWFFPGFCRFVT